MRANLQVRLGYPQDMVVSALNFQFQFLYVLDEAIVFTVVDKFNVL